MAKGARYQFGDEPQLQELGARHHAVRGHGSVGLRLIADDNKRPVRVIGTAFVAGRGLAITAKHNIVDALNALEYSPTGSGGTIDTGGIKLYQVSFDTSYVIWDVTNIFLQAATDLALLEIRLGAYGGNQPTGWLIPKLRVFPPSKSSPITAFGYRAGVLDLDLSADGTATTIRLNDKPTLAKGTVKEIYEAKRDSLICPFPCFEVDVRFHGGLSGGPIMNNGDGSICGVVCTSIEDGSEEAAAASFASTLWPILAAPVTKARYPELVDIAAPMLIDLALAGNGVQLQGVEQLDPSHFPGREDHIVNYARKHSSLHDRLRAGRNRKQTKSQPNRG